MAWIVPREDLVWFEKVTIIVNSSFIMFSYVGAMMYYCFGWLCLRLLKDLSHDMTSKNWTRKAFHRRDAHLLSDQWKQRYLICTDVITQFGHCFSFHLLVSITSAFVWTINSSFYTVTISQQGELFQLKEILSLAGNLRILLEFCLTVYLPSGIRWQVNISC